MSRAHRRRGARPLTPCVGPRTPHLPPHPGGLILHPPDETHHALNTARLAALGLANAEMRIGEHFPELESELATAGVPAWLLFPGEGTQTVEQLAASAAGEPVERLLIVPDGTWRKARRLLYCNPWLAGLPRLALEDGLVSRYRLRKAPAAGALSTIEAIVHCLNGLEVAGRFDALLRPFEALIETQIAAMGEEVYRRNHLRGDAPAE